MELLPPPEELKPSTKNSSDEKESMVPLSDLAFSNLLGALLDIVATFASGDNSAASADSPAAKNDSVNWPSRYEHSASASLGTDESQSAVTVPPPVRSFPRPIPLLSGSVEVRSSYAHILARVFAALDVDGDGILSEGDFSGMKTFPVKDPHSLYPERRRSPRQASE